MRSLTASLSSCAGSTCTPSSASRTIVVRLTLRRLASRATRALRDRGSLIDIESMGAPNLESGRTVFRGTSAAIAGPRHAERSNSRPARSRVTMPTLRHLLAALLALSASAFAQYTPSAGQNAPVERAYEMKRDDKTGEVQQVEVVRQAQKDALRQRRGQPATTSRWTAPSTARRCWCSSSTPATSTSRCRRPR